MHIPKRDFPFLSFAHFEKFSSRTSCLWEHMRNWCIPERSSGQLATQIDSSATKTDKTEKPTLYCAGLSVLLESDGRIGCFPQFLPHSLLIYLRSCYPEHPGGLHLFVEGG